MRRNSAFVNGSRRNAAQPALGYVTPKEHLGLPRRDKGRLFIELTPEAVADLRREIVERSVPSKESWWGYDVIQVDDPDGNELLLPFENATPQL